MVLLNAKNLKWLEKCGAFAKDTECIRLALWCICKRTQRCISTALRSFGVLLYLIVNYTFALCVQFQSVNPSIRLSIRRAA